MTVSELCVDVRYRRNGAESCARLALDGLRLCHGHRRELTRLLAELPARYDDLEGANTPSSGGSHGNGHPGLNVDDRTAELRSQIRYDLLTWCTYVAHERGLNGPARDEPNATAAWLTTHIDWLAAREDTATSLLPVLRELTGRTYGLIDIPARHVDLDQQCLVHVGGQRCIGIVSLVVRGDDWTAVCPVCRDRAKLAGEPYVPQDATPYLRLVRRGQWITVAEVIQLAALFGIAASEDVVRQWKHRRRIRGRIGLLQNEYDLRSVQRYLAQRQAETRRLSA